MFEVTSNMEYHDEEKSKSRLETSSKPHLIIYPLAKFTNSSPKGIFFPERVDFSLEAFLHLTP